MTSLSRRTLLAATLAAPAVIAVSGTASAQTPSVYAENGVAVDGTDVVAYFTESKPVAGKASITHLWNGATWRFASEANRDAFAADPEAYAPQYGGYCAYAVSNGYTASTDPKAWSIVDGNCISTTLALCAPYGTLRGPAGLRMLMPTGRVFWSSADAWETLRCDHRRPPADPLLCGSFNVAPLVKVRALVV